MALPRVVSNGGDEDDDFDERDSHKKGTNSSDYSAHLQVLTSRILQAQCFRGELLWKAPR
jgi:hypothetical protein